MSATVTNIRNLVFGYFLLFFVFSMYQVTNDFLDKKIYLVFASFSSLFVSFMILRLMFKPTKIKGIDRTYVVGPDLGIIREENIVAKRIIPEEAPCEFCDKVVFKPFVCVNCKKLLCGIHMLPEDHNCPNQRI
jgi:hypothetical protein